MSKTLTTNFKNNNGSGTITLFKNPFAKTNGGSLYYGRFDRTTVDVNTLIARIQNKEAGTNALALQQSAGFLKEEILSALSNGEAVNVLDLGVLYIATSAKFNSPTLETTDGKNPLCVKFTPSSDVQNAVSSIDIKNITIADTGVKIEKIYDSSSKTIDQYLTMGKTVILEGEKVKLDESPSSGIYICPIDEKSGSVTTNQTLWVKSMNIISNGSKKIIFEVPDSLTEDAKYAVAIRTSFSTGKKNLLTAKESVSMVLTARKA